MPGGPSGIVRLREPSARYYYNWTPALIRSAEVAAMSGNLRLAADLCEWMMGDDRVMAVLDTRCDALLGLPFELVPQGDARQAGRVAREVGATWETAFPEGELKKLLGWGILLGVGLAQVVWKDGDDGMLVPHLDVWSPRWLSWDWTKRSWMIEAVGEDSSATMPSQKEPFEPGDGQWLLYTPSGVSRPWIHGAYRALARWTLLKQYALTDWGFYSERLGQGVWVAETDTSKGSVGTGTSEQRKELAADIQALGRNSAVALNPGQTLKLIESVARQQDNFRAQIELADNGTAVAILGQNLTTQAGTGTMGAASLHGKVAHGRTRLDGKTLPACLRAHALVYAAEWNYGDPALAPRPCWDTTPIDDAQAKAAVRQMDTQADATLVGAGIQTPNEARARYGLPPLPGGDELRAASGSPSPTPTPAPTASASNPTQSSADALPTPSPDDDPEAEAAE